MATGKIGVTTENIFPVIKKFLYSDHEIFLRELVSNAIDATQKLKTLSSFGEFKGELGEMNVKVSIDKEAGTLTISDHGIGMDAEDINKYINQIAFSGAEEFLQKYKDTANSIIGHFGLGFYSAFMVSKKVVIKSLSYKEGAKAVEWECDGSPEYEMREIEKNDRGTDVILYIDDDNKEFLEQLRIDTLLKKYCRFLPVPVLSGKEQEWKDGKYVDTDKDKVINASEPLWTKKPAELTDNDYLEFYHELMPGMEDPMFWIHLNVDYPFTLTGILYFPKIRTNFDVQKNRIQLYCNQVYVTDQVEGVVPEFMTLMQGVIDSPDIPLNVSRSYLQADQQVKKISAYISKKVAEKLDKMFKEDRKAFEEKWDDIKVFIEYGMLTDEKFYESAKKFFLLKDVSGTYYTLQEYKTLVEAEQTDKYNNVIYLYATDKSTQFPYIKAAEEKGYNVLLMDGQLDNHIIGFLEQKLEKIRFVRVDADIPDRLIVKSDSMDAGLTPLQTDVMSTVIRSQIPQVEKAQFIVSFAALKPTDAPATITQNEFMRRMKEMSEHQPGGGFYAQMPDSYEIIVNTKQPIVEKIIELASSSLQDRVAPIRAEIETLNNEISAAQKEAEEKKTPAPDLSEKQHKVADLRSEEEKIVSEYAKEQPKVRQIIDLALLQSHLLHGENLNDFIKRSIDMLD
ncbi:MAG: molecular chaperone HtpG [Muribaculaceae bacterium]|nr:molecular chaperone HtpG [Muribaculaceae bacterium]